MKEIIFKSVTAIICVAIFSLTLSSAIGNYGDAVKIAAEKTASVSAVGNTGNSTDGTSDTDIIYDTVNPDAEADSTVPESDADTDTTTPDTGETATDPTAYTKEQVVKFYTDSMNKSYNAQKVSIKKTDVIAINVEEITPGGQAAAKLANKIVEAYAKTTEYTKTFSKGIATDESKEKAAGFAVPVALDPKGAKTATVTKKGNDYEINITVVAESATLEKFPVYNKQCSFPLNLASVDLFGLKVTKADFNYSGTTLKAIVGADGYVKSAEVYMPLAGSGGGNFIGINGGATVSGSLKKTLSFTY